MDDSIRLANRKNGQRSAARSRSFSDWPTFVQCPERNSKWPRHPCRATLTPLPKPSLPSRLHRSLFDIRFAQFHGRGADLP
jgi:hypothetical protein